MSSIPAFDLTQQYNIISEELGTATLEVLASSQYINGPRVQQFEQQFADYIGTAHGIGCNSGTDALYLALRALDIGPGDEVITTSFTFVATAGTVSAVGATPVFVDIDPQTFNLDVHQIEAAITNRTKALVVVHLFGQAMDMDQIMAIAHRHNLAVIEDCAQATGARWNGATVGSIGHMGCFSFYPTKNLGACGDGGAVTTQNETLAATVRMLRDHGQRQRYSCEAVGLNSRLDALQAAILTIKLRYLDGWNAQRQAIAARYQQLLSPLPGIVLPQTITAETTVWNQYTIRVPLAATGDNRRDALRQHLQQRGVGSMIYYPIPLHRQPVYTALGYGVGSLPKAEQAAQEVLSLPMFPELSTTQQDDVVYALKDSLEAIASLG